ncbi:MAG: ester cyclase [Burkholderiaceae bacterium]
MQPAAKSATPSAVIERYYDEVWAQRRPERIDSLFAPGYQNHAGARGTLSGPAGIRKNYDSLLTAFPDVRFSVDDLIAAEDRVAVRYTMFGTHRGLFQDLAPTGRAVEVPGIGIYRVADGLIQESWVVRDSLVLLRQLGAA